MDDVINACSTFFTEKGWIIQVFAVVFFTLILNYIVHRVYKKLLPKAKQTHLMWDEALLKAVYSPLRLLVWVLGVTFAAQMVGYQSHNDMLVNAIGPIRSVTFVVIIMWLFLRFISYIEVELVGGSKKKKKAYDKTTVRAVAQIARVSVLITSVLIALQTIGISVSAVLAFGGAGGIVVGFAAKDLLANFFGGLMIYLDRPFSVGDWIRSPDRQIEGTVEHIGWRLTRIRTFDKRPLYIPNGIFSTISVENPSRMTNRRIYTNIGVRYSDASKINSLLKDIETMLQNHPEIDTNQVLMVNLVEFGASSLDFMIYTFTKTTDWVKFQAIQQDVFVKTIEIIEKAGAECAFPTQTLHVPEAIQVKQG